MQENAGFIVMEKHQENGNQKLPKHSLLKKLKEFY